MKKGIIILTIIALSFKVISANTNSPHMNFTFEIALIKTITMVNPQDTFEEYGGFYQGDLKPLGIKNPEVIVKEYVPKTRGEKKQYENFDDSNYFYEGETFEEHFLRLNRSPTTKKAIKYKSGIEPYWNNLWNKI